MTISRRTFIVSGLAAGGALGVWAVARRLDDGDAADAFAATTPGAIALNAWVKILPDGSVVCGVHRAEMGQGVTTALPMLLAEELDVEWGRVRFEFTLPDRDYFNFGLLLRGRPLGDTAGRPLAQLGERAARGALHALGLSMTVGSTSIVDAWDTLRPAGAAARALLLAAAARRWQVPVERLATAAGSVFDAATGRRAAYAELAAQAAQERIPEDLQLRDPAAFRLVGTSPPRLDVPAKVTGAAEFGIDVRRPDMLYATVRHSPLAGTRLAGVDNLAEVSGMAGVAGVVRLGSSAVAVVAGDTWTALRGAQRLSLEPEPTDAQAPDSEAMFTAWRQALDDTGAVVVREEGDAPAALGAAATVLEAHYEQPYLAHLCMEPMNCTALVEPGGVTVWVPTQAESIARDAAARAAEVAPARVTVHRTFLGGGFGRRAEMDFVTHAVRVAGAFPGRPVKLSYGREEDVRADMYRPATVARVRAALGPDGRIAALDYALASQSTLAGYVVRTPAPLGGNAGGDAAALEGAADLPYTAVPNLRCAWVAQQSPVPVGFWRSTGSSQNCFVIEAFMDELAAAAGADPLEFRLAHLADRPRHQAVLREAAARAGWSTPLPPGRGRGVALTASHGSIVAQVVEVAAAADGAIRVTRVVCVIDPGVVVHPDTVVAQVEGGVLDGLAAALHGRIALRGGAIEQGNFDDCRLLTLAEAPPVEVVLMPGGGRPGGVGETAVPGAAPALVNAIFAATGRRVRRLPLDA